MARAEQRAGFGDQVLEMADDLGTGLQRAVAIGRHVEVVRGSLFAAQFEGAVVGAGGDGGIDHGGERNGLEFDLVAAFALDGERSAVAPGGGNRERGVVLEGVGLRAPRIEQHLIPVEDGQLRGGGTAAGEAVGFGRRDEIESHFERGGAGGDFQMEGVHVVAVAPPGNALAGRLDLEAYQVGDGAGGTVLAGDPFGIQERHGAGLGGHGHSHMEEAPCGVGGIHLQLDRSLRVQRQSQQREESNGGNTHSFDSSNAPCARASAVKCHTDLLSEFEFRRLPFYLTFASVVAVLCSNSASNCLIGAAVVALVVCHFRFGDALRFPPVELPLGLFFLATLISLALSGHIGEGWPGPRKFYLCVVLLLVASTFRKLSEVRALVVACTGAMTLSALWSLGQFWRKVQEAQALHEDFRTYYTVKRITGFTSHWMTLSGQEMMVLMLLCALLFFAAGGQLTRWLCVAGVVIATAFVAAYTRSMWMGAALGGGYLVWLRNRRWLFLAPVPVVLLLWLNPMGVGDRMVSVYHPAGDLDSNQFRVVCRRAGWEMIKAHPCFGLGPEQVKAQFLQYIPADIPRPLPTGAYMHLHNVYLQYAAERGVPALIAYLWFLGKMLFDFRRAARGTLAREGERRFVLHGAVAVMIAALSAGWYEHNLNDGEILTLFLAVCACGYLAVPAGRGRMTRTKG